MSFVPAIRYRVASFFKSSMVQSRRDVFLMRIYPKHLFLLLLFKSGTAPFLLCVPPTRTHLIVVKYLNYFRFLVLMTAEFTYARHATKGDAIDVYDKVIASLGVRSNFLDLQFNYEASPQLGG